MPTESNATTSLFSNVVITNPERTHNNNTLDMTTRNKGPENSKHKDQQNTNNERPDGNKE